MRVWLDPDSMAARGVTAADVRNALLANNFTSAAGQVKGDFTQTSINALTSLDNGQGFRPARRLNTGDALMRLGDVADIELGPESVDSSSVFDGLKAVFIGVYATPTANPLTVIDDVRKAFPSTASRPAGGHDGASPMTRPNSSAPRSTRSPRRWSKRRVIVIVVIFLFLGNLRSTFIPIVTIPLSLVGVMIFLLLLGYSINLLTLLALVLAIGLVVDDAIVVVENIYRHIEEGMTPCDAALQGAREIALPGHRHDDHACRRLCADRLRLRPHRRSVPGIRLYAGRLGHRLGLHRADPVADDVLVAVAHASTTAGGGREGRRGMVDFSTTLFDGLAPAL